MDEGKVGEEKKKGNDGADDAANLGAIESQAREQKLGKMYCRCHQLSRKFMTVILKFIVGLRIEDQRLMEKDAQKLGHFDRSERSSRYRSSEDAPAMKKKSNRGCIESRGLRAKPRRRLSTRGRCKV